MQKLANLIAGRAPLGTEVRGGTPPPSNHPVGLLQETPQFIAPLADRCAHAKPPSRLQYAIHLRQRAGLILKPFERAVQVNRVESGSLKVAQVFRAADTKRDTRGVERPCKIDALRRGINTDNASARPDTIEGKSSKPASPATHVQGVIARAQPEQIDQIASVRELGIADLIVAPRPVESATNVG